MSHDFKSPDLTSLINGLSKTNGVLEGVRLASPTFDINNTIKEGQRQNQEMAEIRSREMREKKNREIRNLEINEERLELDKLKLFLLQSVNKDQEAILKKLDSLIDTVEFGDKVGEANLAIIQKELLDIKQSADNLNDSFLKLVQKKMLEMGVESAVKYMLVGIKTLFLNP